MEKKCALDDAEVIAPIFCAWSRIESLGNRFIFDRIGMSPAAFKILTFIARKHIATPSDMLTELGGTKSNLSQRLASLERKGLISREGHAHSDDRRRIPFSITETGKHELRQTLLIAKKAGLSFKDEFTEEELKHHTAFFTKLAHILDQKEQRLEAYFKKNPRER
jgi:DNA-binding MarR family transcriptional regulator